MRRGAVRRCDILLQERPNVPRHMHNDLILHKSRIPNTRKHDCDGEQV